MFISVKGESTVIQGHVLDVARPALLAALRRYDPQLYLKWSYNKKRPGKGYWELRRKPELKSVREGRFLDTPNGRIFYPGDIYDMGDYTIIAPKYHETKEDCVKTFDTLGYHILDWVAKQDLWKYGFKGKDFVKESEYMAAKFEEKIDEDSDAERQYMLKDMRTQIRDFREYVLSGGNPYRLLDFWK